MPPAPETTMDEPQFGCPACESTNVKVRSETKGYDYDAVVRWDEDGEPAEVEPFEPTPPELEGADDGELTPEDEKWLRFTRFNCWSCSAQFPDPVRLEGGEG